MIEIRKDYLLDRWVIIAEARAKRPKEFKKEEELEPQKMCFFCPGNEHATPPEIGRIEEKGAWKIRWFANKFPAVKPEGKVAVYTHDFMKEMPGYGYHEVIVETNHPEKQLWDLPEQHIKKVFQVYAQRMEELSKRQHVKYVMVFKNHGREAGTSIIHSHTQLATLPIIPTLIKEELHAIKEYEKVHHVCPFCRIIEKEKERPRFCF